MFLNGDFFVKIIRFCIELGLGFIFRENLFIE